MVGLAISRVPGQKTRREGGPECNGESASPPTHPHTIFCSMVPSFEVRTLSGKTAFIDGDGIPDVAALRDRIASLEGVPADALRLTSNAQELHAGKQLPHGTSVTVLLRLLGGKGGFGAMLRTAGARGVKTTNFDACRDLNGRRLRHVNAEQRLREWDQQAEERKLKKQQEDAKRARTPTLRKS